MSRSPFSFYFSYRTATEPTFLRLSRTLGNVPLSNTHLPWSGKRAQSDRVTVPCGQHLLNLSDRFLLFFFNLFTSSTSAQSWHQQIIQISFLSYSVQKKKKRRRRAIDFCLLVLGCVFRPPSTRHLLSWLPPYPLFLSFFLFFFFFWLVQCRVCFMCGFYLSTAIGNRTRPRTLFFHRTRKHISTTVHPHTLY